MLQRQFEIPHTHTNTHPLSLIRTPTHVCIALYAHVPTLNAVPISSTHYTVIKKLDAMVTDH